jgi:hypothetical protein
VTYSLRRSTTAPIAGRLEATDDCPLRVLALHMVGVEGVPDAKATLQRRRETVQGQREDLARATQDEGDERLLGPLSRSGRA